MEFVEDEERLARWQARGQDLCPVDGMIPVQVGRRRLVAACSQLRQGDVVLPTWRGPPTNTMRSARSAVTASARYRVVIGALPTP